MPEDRVSLETVEVELINQALQRAEGNRSRASRLLGLTRDTLLYRMKKHVLGGARQRVLTARKRPCGCR